MCCEVRERCECVCVCVCERERVCVLSRMNILTSKNLIVDIKNSYPENE